jgi:uncharacterized protein YyaL (SSP411 family)
MKNEKKSRVANNLVNEKSPYLLQHAYNPVNWYPWSDEAFDLAKSENKPIFLSIGYSTCHWCHVMEQESFEDSELAKQMNEVFVSIKVDREERPDIDKVYMTICQAITGSGGWPMTIIMTPDKKPFFAATYIPKQSRFGQMGMLDLMSSIQNVWQNRKHEAKKNAEKIIYSLGQQSAYVSGEMLDKSVMDRSFEQLKDSFDDKHGGFGRAPKFSISHNLLFLLRYWKRSGNQYALQMVIKTLKKLRNGGIFDQVGYGFHRYSTDQYWMVPHFEKMLYDQAMLAMAFIEAYQATKILEFKDSAEKIFEYVLRDLTAPSGSFYSAEDADSEGVEGKFYTWTKVELEKILSNKEFELALKIYHIKSMGNYKDEASGQFTGANILYINKSFEDLAKELNITIEELQVYIETIRKKLLVVREKRIRPQKDDKILTDWNGLMIAAMGLGAQVFENSVYLEAAEKAMDFILKKMLKVGVGLLHRYRDNEVGIHGYLDDYSFLTWGLIELYEATFDNKYLDTAIKLTDELLLEFWDNKSGGFFFTSNSSEELLIRQKELYDGVIPSGNSVSFVNLLRLARLTGKPHYETRASEMVKTFSNRIQQIPSAFTQFLIGLDFVLGPTNEVIIKGDEQSLETKKILTALRTHFLPNKIVHLNPPKYKARGLFSVPEPLGIQTDQLEQTKIFVCKNYSCQKPTTDVNEMLYQLGLK